MMLKPFAVHTPDGKNFYDGEPPAANAASRNKIAAAIHYPGHWDQAAYPTLDDAILEAISRAKLECSECATPQSAVALDDERAALLADYIELNMSNYGPDDVDKLNAWAIDAYDFVTRAAPPAVHPVKDGERHWSDRFDAPMGSEHPDDLAALDAAVSTYLAGNGQSPAAPAQSTKTDVPINAFAISLLSAAAKSGDAGAIKLAAQLADVAPCEQCGFVNYRCRCTSDEREQTRALTDAACDVLAERNRQVTAEGWTPEHDDQYTKRELAYAAEIYAVSTLSKYEMPLLWPFPSQWWKPSTPRRNLVKAGALILAEIERLDRAAANKRGSE